MATSEEDDENDGRVTATLLSGLSQDNIFYGGFVSLQLIGLIMIALVGIWVEKYLNGFGFENPNQIFNWHPLLMTIGMIWLNANGILIYRVCQTWKRPRQKYVHAALQFATLAVSSAGIWSVFHFHNATTPPIPNYYSLHSWLGGIVMTGMVVNWIVGFLTFLYPEFSPLTRRLTLPIHRFGGSAVFALTAAVAVTGLTEKAIFSLKSPGASYKDLPPAAVYINLIGLFIVLFTGMALWLITTEEFRRRKFRVPGVNETQMAMKRQESID